MIRLQSRLGEESVAGLRSEFRDILLPGGDVRASEALPQESDETDILGLPRLVLDFDRKRFSRLRSLVDRINEL